MPSFNVQCTLPNGDFFPQSINGTFQHVLLGLVLGKKIFVFSKKSALIELRGTSRPILRKTLYLCNKGWGTQLLYIRCLQMSGHAP